MPIPVTCECGHRINVADSMAGKKGRCPKCDAVLEIPDRRGRFRRKRAETADGAARGGASALTLLSAILSVVAVIAFLALAGAGVFTGVTALKGPGSFAPPFGLFEDFAEVAADQPTITGIGFILGGIAAGSLAFLFLLAAAQMVRLLVRLEQSLAEIADRL